MLFLLIQAAQQAKQVAPNVYVTVQQPPAGMPEWVKSLISAGFGAAFGIGSNVAMEYVKPWLAERKAKRSIAKQLREEMAHNIETLVNARFIAQIAMTEDSTADQEVKKSSMEMIKSVLDQVAYDRYTDIFENQKNLFYELNFYPIMTPFYKTLTSLLAFQTEDAGKMYREINAAVVFGMLQPSILQIDGLLSRATREELQADRQRTRSKRPPTLPPSPSREPVNVEQNPGK